ncbi:MAG: T9SS type A sorting domain-containing protein [Ignavibacteria bacterium]|nr:T9SS type A sorting domain-containing protein [Ignavibacteria bacterium]
MKTILLISIIALMFNSAHGHVWPSGGATEQPLIAGTPVTITWDDAISSQHVRLELWDGERAVRTQIATHIRSVERRYEWTIPADLPSGNHYRFVVRDESRPSIAVYSHGFASIVRAHPITSTVASEPPVKFAIALEPQPATDRLRATWSVDGVTQLEIRDVAGQLHWDQITHPQTSTIEIDTQRLPSGAYTLVLHRQEGQTVMQTFMIKR